MSTKPWKNKTHIHLDRQARTEKEYTLLALIFAANQAMNNIKNNSKYKDVIKDMNIEEMIEDSSIDKKLSDEIRENYQKDVIKRLQYSLELFKTSGAGTYGKDANKIEDQFYRTYTPALEFGIFINGELDLSQNAKKVANGEITIRQYIDKTFFNFICIVNNETVHVIYEILIEMKKKNIETISKEFLESIFQQKIDSDGIKTVIEWMSSGTVFFRKGDNIEINPKYSINELISHCNLMYYKKTLDEIKNSNLHNQKEYANYVSGSINIMNNSINDNKKCKEGENCIYYGAPGTGKSHRVEEIARDKFHISYRTTFYPEYTHDDFVGSFMPVMNYELQNPEKEYVYGDGTPSSIVGKPVPYYTFVPGPFTNALVDAMNNPEKNVILIIEELNRANASAVFGEIFQLLDRKYEGKDTDGESRYEINISNEFSEYLSSEVVGYNNGDKIKIPSNLSIYATMNSADQGVNPLDSAFKRRWNFIYVPIDFNEIDHKDFQIDYAGVKVTWEVFATTINKQLKGKDINEDKHLGEYFVNKNEITHKYKFASKILLYLFDDVLKFNRRGFFKSEYKTFSELLEGFNSGKEIFDFKFETKNIKQEAAIDSTIKDGQTSSIVYEEQNEYENSSKVAEEPEDEV